MQLCRWHSKFFDDGRKSNHESIHSSTSLPLQPIFNITKVTGWRQIECMSDKKGQSLECCDHWCARNLNAYQRLTGLSFMRATEQCNSPFPSRQTPPVHLTRILLTLEASRGQISEIKRHDVQAYAISPVSALLANSVI